MTPSSPPARRSVAPSPRGAHFPFEGPDLAPARMRQLARAWLEEDRARQDVSSRSTVPKGVRAVGLVVGQRAGVVSGLLPAMAVAREMGLKAVAQVAEGSRVGPGTRVLRLEGDARALLGCERTVLNLIMHLSGVATATSKAVAAVRRTGRSTVVAATRKTLPGLRDLEKLAVVHGGGDPHRRDLSSAVLVKSNQLALASLPFLLSRGRRRGRATPVIVEVRTLSGAKAALRQGADRLLLDNLSPSQVRKVVRGLEREGLRRAAVIEVSGGITPGNVASYARAGADVASLGSITHSAPALPFHLVVRPLGRRGR